MALSLEVPDKWDVAIDGRVYQVDREAKDGWTKSTVPLLRGQGDNADTPSERTINPEELWPRAMESHHHGAGQAHRDRPESDHARFRESYGIDPWEENRLKLLKRTASAGLTNGASSNWYLVVAGARLYAADGQTLRYTTDLSSWSAVTGTPAATIVGLTSDGFTVWADYGASGIYTTNTGTGAASQLVSSTVGGPIGYVKGRLMVANTNILYNITVFAGAPLTIAAASPSFSYTHPNSDFRWVGFAEGRADIYAAGYSGDKSLIYKTAVKADGTALDVPVVAGELPDGEVVTSIYGYLGFILIGTTTGFRLAIADSNGFLTIGALVDIGVRVDAFEGQGQYVWFSWPKNTGYPTNENLYPFYSGLGRMDLTAILDRQVPAYATDLFVSASDGPVRAIATFLERRVFTLYSDTGVTEGVYAESASLYVTLGAIASGFITFGLASPKTAVYVDVRNAQVSGGAYAMYLFSGGRVFGFLTYDSLEAVEGSISHSRFTTGQVSADEYEVVMTLASDPTNATSPIITRQTLLAYPAPSRSIYFDVPLLLKETVVVGDQEEPVDIPVERAHLDGICQSGRLVNYQEGEEVFSVQLQDYRLFNEERTRDRKAWQGTCLVRLKNLGGIATYVRSATTAGVTGATSLATTLPSTAKVGDLLVLAVGTNGIAINTPAGWTDGGEHSIAGYRNRVFYRKMAAGDTAPTVTTVSSATIAAIVGAVRGVDTFDVGGDIVDLGASVGIYYTPNLTVANPDSVLLVSAVSQLIDSTPVKEVARKAQGAITLVLGEIAQRSAGQSGARSGFSAGGATVAGRALAFYDSDAV